MRYLKNAVIILFVLSIGLYGFSKFEARSKYDPTVPVIKSMVETLEIPCKYTDEQLLAGLSANDGKDGDLTPKIMFGNFSKFQEKGKCKATYVVFDSSNQSTTFTRNVVFTDYKSPEFNLVKPLILRLGGKINSVYYNVGAKDLLDGDISNSVKIKNQDINNNVAGDYNLEIEVNNSFGDISELKLPVHVISSSDYNTEIELNDYLVYVDKNSEFHSEAYVKSATGSNGKELSAKEVKFESNVNTAESGVYEVKYSVNTDGYHGVNWMTVVVR